MKATERRFRITVEGTVDELRQRLEWWYTAMPSVFVSDDEEYVSEWMERFSSLQDKEI